MEVFFFFILINYSYSTAMACSYDTKITALTGKALSRQGPRPRKKPRGPLSLRISQKCHRSGRKVPPCLERAAWACILDMTTSKG